MRDYREVGTAADRRRSGLAPLRVHSLHLSLSPSFPPFFPSSFSRLSRSSVPLSLSLSPSRGRLGYSRYLRRVRVREPRTVLRRLRCDERSRQEARGRSCIQGEYLRLPTFSAITFSRSRAAGTEREYARAAGRIDDVSSVSRLLPPTRVARSSFRANRRRVNNSALLGVLLVARVSRLVLDATVSSRGIESHSRRKICTRHAPLRSSTRATTRKTRSEQAESATNYVLR